MNSCRLAITNISHEKVKVSHIFKIFESMMGNKVKKVNLYKYSKKDDFYFIVFFETNKYAQEAYEQLEGLEIEQSGNILNLSFVPDDMNLDDPIEECDNSNNFEIESVIAKDVNKDSPKIELVVDEPIDFDIPEEFRSPICQDEAASNNCENTKKSSKTLDSDIHNAIAAEDEKDNLDDFSLNLKDARFKEIFEDEDYVLDASNKKFKLQKSSMDILKYKMEQNEKNTD